MTEPELGPAPRISRSSTDTGHDGGAPPRWLRETRRPLLAAAVVVVVAAVTTGVALVAPDREAERPTTVVDQSPATRPALRFDEGTLVATS